MIEHLTNEIEHCQEKLRLGINRKETFSSRARPPAAAAAAGSTGAAAAAD